VAGLVRRHPVTGFFVLAYALSWSWWLPIASTGGIVRPGDPWPTHFPGLLGPLAAAFAVTALVDGRSGMRALATRMLRWRGGWRTLLLVCSPLIVLALAVPVAAVVDGHWPVWTDFLRMSGVAPIVPIFILYLLFINGFGEETGWRGFAQERLQARHGTVRVTLLVTLGWAGWHLPLFVILASYQDFHPAVLSGFLLGLAAGSFDPSGDHVLVQPVQGAHLFGGQVEVVHVGVGGDAVGSGRLGEHDQVVL
jgi:CAAX protease family protein